MASKAKPKPMGGPMKGPKGTGMGGPKGKKYAILAAILACLALIPGLAVGQTGAKWVFANAQSNDDGKAVFEIGMSIPKIVGISSIGHAAIGNYARFNWDLVKWFDVDFFNVIDAVYIVGGPGLDYTEITPEDSPDSYITGSAGFGATKVIHRFKDKTGKLGFDPGLAIFGGIKTYTPLPDSDTYRFSFHLGIAIQVTK